MKPSSPNRLVVEYENGDKYYYKIDMESEQWKKMVPIIYANGHWEIKMSFIQKIKYTFSSLFSL